MGNDLISIILPVYNGQRFLSESIQSCLKQTYRNFELIIINDCSTDDTLSIARKFAVEDDRIQIHTNKVNLQLSKSLNVGHSIAKGKYITWTSDDNCFHETAIEKLLNFQRKEKVDLVYAHCNVIDEAGKISGFLAAKSCNHLLFENSVGACFLYTKAIYSKAGGYNPQMTLIEDYDFWLRVSKIGKIKELPQVFYDYRHHTSSLTSKIKRDVILNKKFLDAKRKMFEGLSPLSDAAPLKNVIDFLIATNRDAIVANKILQDSLFVAKFIEYVESFNSFGTTKTVQILLSWIVDLVLRNPELQTRAMLSFLYKTPRALFSALSIKRHLTLIRKCL